MGMFKEGDFTPDAVKDLHISYETMFTQVPIVIKNSHLMNALMLEMQESLTLDVGTAHTLETELRAMMDAVDELNQESIKFNKHQNMMFKIPMAPSRLNPLILSGTISHTADEVSEFCSQSVAKLFLTEPLQGAKASTAATASSLGQ